MTRNRIAALALSTALSGLVPAAQAAPATGMRDLVGAMLSATGIDRPAPRSATERLLDGDDTDQAHDSVVVRAELARCLIDLGLVAPADLGNEAALDAGLQAYIGQAGLRGLAGKLAYSAIDTHLAPDDSSFGEPKSQNTQVRRALAFLIRDMEVTHLLKTGKATVARERSVVTRNGTLRITAYRIAAGQPDSEPAQWLRLELDGARIAFAPVTNDDDQQVYAEAPDSLVSTFLGDAPHVLERAGAPSVLMSSQEGPVSSRYLVSNGTITRLDLPDGQRPTDIVTGPDRILITAQAGTGAALAQWRLDAAQRPRFEGWRVPEGSDIRQRAAALIDGASARGSMGDVTAAVPVGARPATGALLVSAPAASAAAPAETFASPAGEGEPGHHFSIVAEDASGFLGVCSQQVDEPGKVRLLTTGLKEPVTVRDTRGSGLTCPSTLPQFRAMAAWMDQTSRSTVMARALPGDMATGDLHSCGDNSNTGAKLAYDGRAFRLTNRYGELPLTVTAVEISADKTRLDLHAPTAEYFAGIISFTRDAAVPGGWRRDGCVCAAPEQQLIALLA